MIRLLAPYSDVDRDALVLAAPGIRDVNEVECTPEDADGLTPAGRWLAGYWDDDDKLAPTEQEWRDAVASAPPSPAASTPLDLASLRQKVANATTISALKTATLAYLDALTPVG